MFTKQEKIENLFDKETKNAVMIPMDHGIGGVRRGLEDPVESLKKFVKLQPDSILINFGVLKLMRDYLIGLDDRPGIIVAVDFNHSWQEWKKPIDKDGIIGHCNITEVKNAAKYDADAVKVLFPLGVGPEVQLDYVRHTAEVINEAEKVDIPVMVEPLTLGKYIDEDRKNDPDIIADGCRFALELGADIIKAPYPGPKYQDQFKEICENANVPVVMLGGPKQDEVRGILTTAREGIDAGARGTIFGRNVWQRPESQMRKVVKSLQAIVHEGSAVDHVVKEYDLNF